MKVLPLSDVAADGNEKKANQPDKKASVHDLVTLSGMAWTKRLVLQTMVSIYLNPLLSGSGPRMSKLIWENLLDGTGSWLIGIWICFPVLTA